MPQVTRSTLRGVLAGLVASCIVLPATPAATATPRTVPDGPVVAGGMTQPVFAAAAGFKL